MALDTDRRSAAIEVAGLLASAAALWYALGAVGVAAAGVVAIGWGVASAVYAFGAGQLIVAVLATTGAGGLAAERLFLAQAGLGVVLLAALVGRWPLRTAVPAAVAFAVTGVGFASLHALEPLWHGVAVLAVLYAFLAYTLHRYELVSLDLVGEADR